MPCYRSDHLLLSTSKANKKRTTYAVLTFLDWMGIYPPFSTTIDDQALVKMPALKKAGITRDINVTMKSGKTAKKTLYEKQVVFWDEKYADKAKAERGEAQLQK